MPADEARAVGAVAEWSPVVTDKVSPAAALAFFSLGRNNKQAPDRVAPCSVNHTAPSRPVAIPSGPLFAVGVGNSLT
jgi:hypothetical protein